MNRISTLLVLGGLSLAATFTQAEQTVLYNQMVHEALGQASLAVSPNHSFLRASNLSASGDDGFRTHQPGSAGFWSAEFITDLKAGDTLHFNPISEDVAIAPLEVTATANGFSAYVEFTSSPRTTYSIMIREAGDLVATWRCRPDLTCQPENGSGGGGGGPGGIIIDVEPLHGPDTDEPTLFRNTFRQDDNDNYAHGMRMTTSGSVSVGGQQLGNGDEIIVVERTKGPRYPYAGFQAMDVQSSAAQIVVINELSR